MLRRGSESPGRSESRSEPQDRADQKQTYHHYHLDRRTYHRRLEFRLDCTGLRHWNIQVRGPDIKVKVKVKVAAAFDFFAFGLWVQPLVAVLANRYEFEEEFISDMVVCQMMHFGRKFDPAAFAILSRPI